MKENVDKNKSIESDQIDTINNHLTYIHLKKVLLTNVLFFGLMPFVVFASEPVIYTFEGKKDPRLEATFSVIYKGTSNAKECTQQNLATATRNPMLAGKSYRIKEENYHIEIPVYQQEADGQCGYQFRRIELVLRRLYDKELYSAHIILDTEQEVMPTYYGYKTGIKGGGGHPLMPGYLFTDKQYFRIATETNYFCRTEFFKRLNSTGFYCFMRIRDGKANSQFIKPTKYNRVTHPEFGVDEMKNEIFKINIMADDEGSAFYPAERDKGIVYGEFKTIPKPLEPKKIPLSWDELKEKVIRWFSGWF